MPLAALSALPLRAVAGAMPPRDRACSLTLLNTHTRESAMRHLSGRLGVRHRFPRAFQSSAPRSSRRNNEGNRSVAVRHSCITWLRGSALIHISVISGYRSPETNALLHERSSGVASHSLHMDGKAIDVRPAV